MRFTQQQELEGHGRHSSGRAGASPPSTGLSGTLRRRGPEAEEGAVLGQVSSRAAKRPAGWGRSLHVRGRAGQELRAHTGTRSQGGVGLDLE